MGSALAARVIWLQLAPPSALRKDHNFRQWPPAPSRRWVYRSAAGRDFDDRDTYEVMFAAVINETLARKSFPGQDPIGRVLFGALDNEKRPMKIVGVVGDVRQWIDKIRNPGPRSTCLIYSTPSGEHISALWFEPRVTRAELRKRCGGKYTSVRLTCRCDLPQPRNPFARTLPVGDSSPRCWQPSLVWRCAWRWREYTV